MERNYLVPPGWCFPHLTSSLLNPYNYYYRGVYPTKETTMSDPGKNRAEIEQSSNKVLRPLLGLPMFYKVLIANSFIIFVGATGGTWLATHLNVSPYATPISLVGFIAAGWLISIALNFVVLQIVFRPLTHLG